MFRCMLLTLVFAFSTSYANKTDTEDDAEKAEPELVKKVSTPKIHLRCDSGGAGWWKAYRRGTPSHKGIDYKCLEGEAIRAWGDGSVLRKGYDRQGYGYWLETSQMVNGVPRVMLHAHLKDTAGKDDFSKGDIIGFCGRTGNVSQNIQTHVHFEIGDEGRQQNPVPILESIGVKVEKGSCSRL